VLQLLVLLLLLPQIMRNTLYKAYLDDFAAFCEKLGGTTADVMSDLLAFEADRRALNITLNRCVCGLHICTYPLLCSFVSAIFKAKLLCSKEFIACYACM
jgi:hypothetical protein